MSVRKASILGYVLNTEPSDQDLNKLKSYMIDFIIARLIASFYKKIKQLAENKQETPQLKQLLNLINDYLNTSYLVDICDKEVGEVKRIISPDYAQVYYTLGISPAELQNLQYVLKKLCEAKTSGEIERILPQSASTNFLQEFLSIILNPKIGIPESAYYKALESTAKRLGLPLFSSPEQTIHFYFMEDPANFFKINNRQVDPFVNSLKEEALSVDEAREMDINTIEGRAENIALKHEQEIQKEVEPLKNIITELKRQTQYVYNAVTSYLNGQKSKNKTIEAINKWESLIPKVTNKIYAFLSNFATTLDESNHVDFDYSLFSKLSVAHKNISPEFSEKTFEALYDFFYLLDKTMPSILYETGNPLEPFLTTYSKHFREEYQILHENYFCIIDKLKNDFINKLPDKIDEETKKKLEEDCK